MSNNRLKRSKKKPNKKNLLHSSTQSKHHTLKLKVLDLLKSHGENTDDTTFIDNPDEIKMSAVILKITESYIAKFWGNENLVKSIIRLAIFIWNMSFLPHDEQEELKDSLVQSFLPNDGYAIDMVTMYNLIAELQKRQSELFPNIRNIILGHALRLDEGNIHLDISSVPIGEKKKRTTNL